MSPRKTLSAEPSSAESAAATDAFVQGLQHHGVRIEGIDPVLAYLQRFPELLPHVVPTVAHVRKEFGEGAELTLTIHDDPESYDPYLKLYISLPAYGPDTLARIDAIQEPLSEATADLEGFFLVTTDHRLVGR